MKMKNENLKMVQGIVDELEMYASGDYFLHNDELLPIDKDEFKSIDGCSIDVDVYIMPDGEEIYEGNIESATLFDYFNDFLDIDYVVDREKQYKGARVMVTCGGPNIYIDSYKGIVELFWWTEHATAEIPANICDEINEIFRDYFYC